MNKVIRKKKKKKSKRFLSPADREKARRKKKMHTTIYNIFNRLGFEYIRTEDKKVAFGGLDGEIDDVFLFENIIIICEETISMDNDHLRKKYDFYEKLREENDKFLGWIKHLGKDKFRKFDSYTNARYKIFYLYFTEQVVDETKRNLYSDFKFLDNRRSRYFLKVADTIRFSGRNEFFKFLGLGFKEVGVADSSYPEKIHSGVIFPEDVSGMPSGVHLASFVMTAQELLDCAYVFRKESWDTDSGYFYQRLIDKKKINRIRHFLVNKKRTFIDSIIVSLPSDTKFFEPNDQNKKGNKIDLKRLDNVSNAAIEIPYESNSIGIIDGQHRVFGHYQGPPNKEETVIARLRKRRHLFVTGLFYEKGKFSTPQKRKFESELFLEINSEQKKVNTQLIQEIQTLKDPLSSIGISTSVLRKLNERNPLVDHFTFSELDMGKNKIKTPTIVKYALRHLVAIDQTPVGLYKYWKDKDKKMLQLNTGDLEKQDLARQRYISFCASAIAQFFSAVRTTRPNDWVFDGKSKLLTVTSMVAFLMSFRTSIERYNGIKDFDFYNKKLSNLKIDFRQKPFPYVSSQWSKLTDAINKCWT